MNIQEAIAVANEMLGQDYFSPQQPAFFVEAARSAGNLDVSAKDPNAPYDWTTAEVEKIVAMTKGAIADASTEVQRDEDMTAKTPPDQRIGVDDLLAQVQKAWLDDHPDDTVAAGCIDRPVFYRLAASLGVTIYTERWPDRRDGKDFIVAGDRPRDGGRARGQDPGLPGEVTT